MADMDIPVIYEDEHMLVVNKPAGLVVHADGKTNEPTLVDWILERYPEIQGVGEPLTPADGIAIERPGIVHRLDRDTSGVLVIAKDQPTFLFFKRQFKDREIKKAYRAFVYGTIKEDSGRIDMAIGRSKSDFRKWIAHPNARGTQRSAVTNFEVLARGKDATYLEAYPKTGRTHQIRVHLKAVHHPVVCDSLYAAGKESLLGFTRTALHALRLTIRLPQGEERTFEAVLPDDFLRAEQEIGFEA